MTPPAPLQLPTADEALDWTTGRTAEGLARAREVVEGLKAAEGLTALEALRRMDEVTLALSNVGALASLISVTAMSITLGEVLLDIPMAIAVGFALGHAVRRREQAHLDA